jgi:hypothetical protein
MRRLIGIACLVGFVCYSLKTLQAQTAYGTILGTVTDASGAVVANANVTVTNLGTNVSSQIKCGPAGNYDVPNRIPGKYQVTVEAAGFKRFVTSDLVMLVNQRLRVDATLQPGAVTSTVNVDTRVQMVNTDSSTISEVVENKEINDLPLVSRNFMELVVLTPGAVVDNSGVLAGTQTLRSSLSGGSIFVGGGRGSSNAYMIDGVENNDPGVQTPTVTPPIDAIQEFSLMTKNYSAEFGGGGAQLNIAIKSGTNSLHGTAYDFLRNDVLNATNFFAVKDPLTGKSKPQLRYNQFGASIGGPIVLPKLFNGRNKLFFFGDYEGTRQRSYSSAFGLFPTADELSGNFSADPPIYNPQTGQQFSGNLIPSGMIDARAKQILALNLFATPNVQPQPGFNTVARLGNPDTIDQLNSRVDYNISEKDTLYGRVSYSTQNIVSPGLSPLSGTSYQQKGWNAGLSEIHVFLPHLVNNLRLGFNRPSSFSQQDGGFAQNLAGQIFQGVNSSPAVFGYPQFSFTNYASAGGTCCAPLDYWTNSISVVDGLDIIRGKHTLKIGGSFRTYTYKEINSNSARGSVGFTGLYTAGPGNTSGNAIADFLLGLPQSAVVNQGLSTSWFHAKAYSAYVQDDWKAISRLTFNLGLRYAYDSPLYEEQGRVSIVDLTYPGGRLLTPNQQIVSQLNSPLLGHTALQGLVAPDYRNWAPRVGFAYRPFKSNSTVVRGGYGIFYDLSDFNTFNFSVNNPPWTKSYAASGTLASPINFDGLFPTAPTAAPVAGSIASQSLTPTDRTPYMEQWNFDVERGLASDWVVDVGYQGSKSTHLQDWGVPTQGQLMPNGTVVYHYTNFSFILLSANAGRSNYNALTARIEKRFSHGYNFQAHYTWSKGMDLASAECGVGTDACYGQQNYWDRNADYGPESFDVTHRLVVSGTYELPFGRGKQFGSQMAPALDKVLGGWQLNGIFQIQSGFPFTIAANDASGTGSLLQLSRADLVGNPHARDPVDPSRVFNRYAFAQPAAGTFGDSRRNILRGAGLNNFDMSIFKNEHLTERLVMQIRAELFNAFNHTQLGPFPGSAFSLDPSSSFGIYTSTQHDARIIQLGLKLVF